MRGSSIQYVARKKKSRKNQLLTLERKLRTLTESMWNQGPSCLTNTEEQIRLVKHDMTELNKVMMTGSIVRSRARWALYSEKPTRYFLNLEKQNYQKKTIID